MKQEHTMDGTRQAIGRDGAAVKNRRTFLTDAGKYGALFAGGTYLAATAGLENRASAQDDLAQGSAEALAGYDAKEKGDMIRIFGVGRRAPGMLRGDMRRKTFIMWTGYANAALREATAGVYTGGQLLFIMNFINEAAFGFEGDTGCLPFVERDFVAEYFMRGGQTQAPGRGGEAQATGRGREAQATEGGREAEATGRGGRAQANARPTFPPSAESGTDLRLAAKQVLAEGKRPLGVAGRERGMFFIKLSATVARDDQVKIWQALHDKAMARAKVFASELVGFELLQRLPNTPDKLMNRCGPEIPVPELVACLWSRSKRGAGEFPTYARAFRQADQQKAIDASSSFFLMTEEWEVNTNPGLIR